MVKPFALVFSNVESESAASRASRNQLHAAEECLPEDTSLPLLMEPALRLYCLSSSPGFCFQSPARPPDPVARPIGFLIGGDDLRGHPARQSSAVIRGFPPFGRAPLRFLSLVIFCCSSLNPPRVLRAPAVGSPRAIVAVLALAFMPLICVAVFWRRSLGFASVTQQLSRPRFSRRGSLPRDLLERETNPAVLYRAFDWMKRHFPEDAILPRETRRAMRSDTGSAGCERCGSSLHDRCTPYRRDIQPLSEEEILRRYDSRR